MIDITMTAIACRPEILEQTLVSLSENLKSSKPLRLIIDIAPGRELGGSQGLLFSIAMLYFEQELICRMVDPSLQAEAIKWAWLRSNAEFVLHWEDDWVLTRGLDLDKVEECFDFYPNIGQVFFDRYKKSVLDYPGYKGKFTKVNPTFYLRNMPTGLAGPPALLLNDYKSGVLPLIKNNQCLDITSRGNAAKEFLSLWRVGMYMGEDGKGNLVKDIGKSWRVERGLKMKKKTPRGVTWIKKS